MTDRPLSERMQRILATIADAKRPAENDDGRGMMHEQFQRTRKNSRAQLREGKLDEREVEVEMRDRSMPSFEVVSSQGVEEMDINFKDILPNLFGQRTKKRRMHVDRGHGIPDSGRGKPAD